MHPSTTGPAVRKESIEPYPALRHLLSVRTFKTLMVALLALAWVPLMSHCLIEVVPGFEFLSCSSDVQTSNEGGDPCKSSGCCAVESAKYQSPRQQEITPIVVVAILPAENFDVLEQSLPAQVSLGVLTAAPPDLPTSWQFSLRTALPVRAPSLAS